MRKNGVDKRLSKIDGGVCAPKGFRVGATCAGVAQLAPCKAFMQPLREDIALLVTERRYPIACVFADEKWQSAPVLLSKKHMRYGYARGVVITSGIANTFGEQAYKDAFSLCTEVEKVTGIEKDELLVMSTGIMGYKYPKDLFLPALRKLCADMRDTPEKGLAMARAMMTTDKAPKQFSFTFALGDFTCTFGAVCKGGKQVSPTMATTLCVITTDVNISAEMLQKALKTATNDTFNMLSLDGVSSPNDTVAMFSSCKAGNYKITVPDNEYRKFVFMLTEFLSVICKALAADGERKVCVCNVTGANSKALAKYAAKSLSAYMRGENTLGEQIDVDGIVCAVLSGCAQNAFSGLSVKLSAENGSYLLFEDGNANAGSSPLIKDILTSDEIAIDVRLGRGNYKATAYTCLR